MCSNSGREFMASRDTSSGWSPFRPQTWSDITFSLPQYRTNPIRISQEKERDDVFAPFSSGRSPSSDLWLSGAEDSPVFTSMHAPTLPMNEIADLISSVQRTPLRFSSPRASILVHHPRTRLIDDLVNRFRHIFTVHVVSNYNEAKALLLHTNIDALVTCVERDVGSVHESTEICSLVRSFSSSIFIVILSSMAVVSADLQTKCMNAGGNMLTDDPNELLNTCIRALKVVGRDPFTVDVTYNCPVCDFGGLMEDELCDHVVLYHGGQPNCDVTCPVCGLMCKNTKVPFPVHIHKSHGPVGRRRQNIPRKQHHTYVFVLVVCHRKRDGRFLMVNEPASWGWWLPGGRVEWGEGLRAAAIRETKEEAGIDIEINGILKFEYTSGPSRTRQRIIFYATPKDENARPKCVPDYDSRGACWVSPDELESLSLRGDEPKIWIQYVVKGNPIHSIDLLSLNRDEE